MSCVDIVRNGVSGYCECYMNDNGTSTSIKMNVSSIHKPFRCVDHCMDYFNTSLTCEDGWIETQNCTRYLNMADSQVIPQKHRSCFSKIERGLSGFVNVQAIEAYHLVVTTTIYFVIWSARKY